MKFIKIKEIGMGIINRMKLILHQDKFHVGAGNRFSVYPVTLSSNKSTG